MTPFETTIFCALSIQTFLLLLASLCARYRKHDAPANYMVGAFVAVILASWGILYQIELANPSTDILASLLMMLRPAPMLMLYLYTDAVLFPSTENPYRRLPRIVQLYAGYCLIFVLVYWLPVPYPAAVYVAVAVSTVFKLVVIAKILTLTFKYDRLARQQYSHIARRSNRWIQAVAGLAILRAVLLSGAILLEDRRIADVSDVIVLTAISITSLAAHLSSAFFVPIADLKPDAATMKYQTSPVSQSELAGISQRITNALAADKLYLRHDLNLRDLASAIDVKPYLASQAINQQLHATFYDLINRYRIDEAKTLLVQQPGARVFDIAVDVGYSTKSAFNAAFKKLTGNSPTDYRSKVLKSSEGSSLNADS